MKTIELTLKQAKELYKQGGSAKEFALQAYSKEELTKQVPPRSWEEFCEKYPIQNSECWIYDDGDIFPWECKYKTNRNRNVDDDKNLIYSKEEAEAFLALMQLRQLRKTWIGDWKPNWEDANSKWCIIPCAKTFVIETYYNFSYLLSFPTEEMAAYFLSCFKDLLEKTRPLYQ